MAVNKDLSLKPMEQHLKKHYADDITNLLNDANAAVHVSVFVCLTRLHAEQPALFAQLCSDGSSAGTVAQCKLWDAALLIAQSQLLEGNAFLEPDFQIKHNCHVRFVRLPAGINNAAPVQRSDSSSSSGGELSTMTGNNTNNPAAASNSSYPTHEQIGHFVQVHGNVVRMTQAKLLEFRREYECSKCKAVVLAQADYSRMYVIDAPRGGCPEMKRTGCRGTLFQRSVQPVAEHCIDVQEIQIQELMSERNMPATLAVTLDNDLVDGCQPGDRVTICGTVELRWRPLQPGRQLDCTLAVRAISVRCEQKRQAAVVADRDLPEHMLCMRAEWQEMLEREPCGELAVRDRMLRSFCPQIHGMYLVKLAVLLALSSGMNARATPNGGGGERRGGGSKGDGEGAATAASSSQTRGCSHVILVGDPGLAKSKLLQFAAAVAVRAVHTTGMGCSSAGLTAAAVKEDGEWRLEAGALVLADGGICCIDEFNMMRECDKASIHEAMEQQSISMAKAGIVCKLSTRCSIVAATNPKNMRAIEATNGQADVNIGIASPLLSRFDVVLILRDERNPEWDARVAQHLLARCTYANDGDDDEDMEDDETAEMTTQQETTAEPLWTEEQFQSHLAVIRDICPTVSPAANAILGAYFRACRADVNRDPARTTVRLLDSLMRLARAHARLMFRNVVTERDAVTVVRLMESSWGFGNLLQPLNVLRAPLPIGPSPDEVRELRERLGLPIDEPSDDEEEMIQNVDDSEVVGAMMDPQPSANRTQFDGNRSLQSLEGDMFIEDDSPAPQETSSTDFTQISLLTNPNFSDSVKKPVAMASQKRTQVEMEEILSFADFVDDTVDETTEPLPTVHPQRPPAKRSLVEDVTNGEISPFKALKPSKGLSAKTANRLNMFRNEKYIERSSSVEAATKPIDDPHPPEDSAYQSILNTTDSHSTTTSTASEPQRIAPSKPFAKQSVSHFDNLDFLDDIDDI